MSNILDFIDPRELEDSARREFGRQRTARALGEELEPGTFDSFLDETEESDRRRIAVQEADDELFNHRSRSRRR